MHSYKQGATVTSVFCFCVFYFLLPAPRLSKTLPTDAQTGSVVPAVYVDKGLRLRLDLSRMDFWVNTSHTRVGNRCNQACAGISSKDRGTVLGDDHKQIGMCTLVPAKAARYCERATDR